MQLELFDSPQLVSSSVIVDRYYFPVIVCGLGSGSLSWTLARSEAEALAFYKHSGVRVFIDRVRPQYNTTIRRQQETHTD